ncbi:MAG: hypothetical protein KC486_09450 [Myxococcales bacterium]|nr:hypothetical protein [Myxococcales bacterium]
MLASLLITLPLCLVGALEPSSSSPEAAPSVRAPEGATVVPETQPVPEPLAEPEPPVPPQTAPPPPSLAPAPVEVAAPSHGHGHGHEHGHGHTHAARLRPNWGGWGHASAGILLGDWGGYRGALSHPSGATLAPARAALFFGGGGAALLAGRYVIGGKGFGVVTPTAAAGWGQVSMNGGGGGFDVGVVVVNTRRWIVFPKFGAGGQGYTMTVTNQSAEDVSFGSDGATIAANSRATFGSGFFTAEAGVGFKRLVYPRTFGGGLINGGDVGVMMSLTDSAWNQGDTPTISGVPPLRMVAAYLRLDVGGGGFWWGEFGGERQKRGRKRR